MDKEDANTYGRISTILHLRVEVISTCKPTLVVMVGPVSSNAEIGNTEGRANKRR
jgi:hypothetical protein